MTCKQRIHVMGALSFFFSRFNSCIGQLRSMLKLKNTHFFSQLEYNVLLTFSGRLCSYNRQHFFCSNGRGRCSCCRFNWSNLRIDFHLHIRFSKTQKLQLSAYAYLIARFALFAIVSEYDALICILNCFSRTTPTVRRIPQGIAKGPMLFHVMRKQIMLMLLVILLWVEMLYQLLYLSFVKSCSCLVSFI